MEKLKFKSRKEAYSFLIDWFNRPGCYLYCIEEAGRKIDETEVIRNLGAWYEVGLEKHLDICCTLGIMKIEEIDFRLRFSNAVHVITAIYYRLTRVGVDFLECCARDDLAKLENHQKDKDEKVRDLLFSSAREEFGKSKDKNPSLKKFDEFLNRWDGQLPTELKIHSGDRRRITRCRLSNVQL